MLNNPIHNSLIIRDLHIQGGSCNLWRKRLRMPAPPFRVKRSPRPYSPTYGEGGGQPEHLRKKSLYCDSLPHSRPPKLPRFLQ